MGCRRERKTQHKMYGTPIQMVKGPPAAKEARLLFIVTTVSKLKIYDDTREQVLKHATLLRLVKEKKNG